MVTKVFLLLAALLAALCGGAMLWPLFRAGKRRLWGALVAGMVVGTLGLYQLLGTPAGLQPQAELAATPQSLEEGVRQLQAAMEKNPARTDGWVLLARSQLELGRVADAAASYERAVKLTPDEPGLLVEAAQTRAQAADGFLFDDTAVQWLEQARQLAPGHERATWLLGIVQRQRGQPAQAAQTWESLLPRLEAKAAAALRIQIDDARADAGLPPSAPPPSAPPPEAPASATAAGDHAIRVQVTLAPALQARAAAGKDTLFVIARVPDGPPMPVAVQRHPAASAPLTVTLDDSNSPMPTQKLSALAEVEVFARLSASGTTQRHPDDVESVPVKVSLPTTRTVEIILGPAVP
ncbi:tetratricopeptide repeat protein [Stenotrophomonas sp. JC08]|uniref:tetratricopeptide repeat protein n=1 Tax=Stenotrophomonas sp. JC08 TaxID=3445779 RepID=UPI003FA28EB9